MFLTRRQLLAALGFLGTGTAAPGLRLQPVPWWQETAWWVKGFDCSKIGVALELRHWFTGEVRRNAVRMTTVLTNKQQVAHNVVAARAALRSWRKALDLGHRLSRTLPCPRILADILLRGEVAGGGSSPGKAGAYRPVKGEPTREAKWPYLPPNFFLRRG